MRNLYLPAPSPVFARVVYCFLVASNVHRTKTKFIIVTILIILCSKTLYDFFHLINIKIFIPRLMYLYTL